MKKTLIKNLSGQKTQIFFLKAAILLPVAQVSFKRFLLERARYNPITIGLLLFPFTMYFSFSQHSSGTTETPFTFFAEKNLPKLTASSSSLSWETFQKTHFLGLPFSPANFSSKDLKPQSKWSQLKFQNQIETKFFKTSLTSVSGWSDFLTLKFNGEWMLPKNQFYLGIFPKSSPQSLTSNYWVVPARDNFTSQQTNQLPFWQTNANNYFYDCDEFPLKVKGFSSVSPRNQLNVQFQNRLFGTVPVFIPELKGFFNVKNLQKADPAIIGVLNTTAPSLVKKKPLNEPFNYNFQGLISPLQTEYAYWKQIEKKSQELFYTKNICYNDLLIQTEEKLEFKKLSLKTKKLSANQFLHCLDTTEPIALVSEQQSDFLDRTRPLETSPKMSGFKYPDMTKDSCLAFLKNNRFLNSKESTVKVILGSHFNYPFFYLPNLGHPVPVKLNFTATKFDLYEKVIYDGPGVEIGEKDEVIKALNPYRVKSSLTAILEKNDPRKNIFGSFFGESDAAATNESSPPSFAKFDQLVIDIDEEKTKKDLLDKPLNTSLFSYDEKLVVPGFSLNQWNNFTKGQFSPSSQPLISYIPTRQIKSLKTTNPHRTWDTLDYPNQDWFFQSLSPTKKSCSKLALLNGAPRQSMFSDEITSTAFLKAQFQRRPTSYPETKNEGFLKPTQLKLRKSWESIHLNSWLISYQYFFALLIIYICKEFVVEYAKELGAYLIDLVASLGIVDESFKDEILPQQSSSGTRFIEKTNKKFSDIAGIDSLFSELSELVWFLRNSGRSFKVGNILPKGILLVGRPGTGKTLLVQALAGEAQVPVFVQSASALKSLEGLGAQRIQNLFDKAKQYSPSIIFFDEIDSIGERRSNVLQNPIGTTSLGESSRVHDLPNLFAQNYGSGQAGRLTKPTEQTHEQLSVLMQLLIELDGLQSRRLVLVIGATNRPESLDPALTRPGRFDKVFTLGFPGKKKRIDICHLYGTRLGLDSKICWDYIGNRTIGLSGADLAAIMNQSSIQAILTDSLHTMETLEYGIEKITNYSCELEAEIRSANQPFGISRFAYYHSGLAIAETLLSRKTPSIYCSLWPKQNNSRSNHFQDQLASENYLVSRREDFEANLISLLSGKASELLFFNNLSPHWQSNLGTTELKKATYLAFVLVDKWHFYSKTSSLNKIFNFTENRNYSEIFEPSTLEFFHQATHQMELDPIQKEYVKYRNFQRWSTKPWWQIQVLNETQSVDKNSSSNWYRIYMYNPEESEANEEWMPPDCYFHNNGTYFLTKTMQLVDSQQSVRDLLYQSLLTNTFKCAWELCQKNREFLDFFADCLIQNQLLRQHEIEILFKQFFGTSYFYQDSGLKVPDYEDTEWTLKQFEYEFEKQWGKLSRKRSSV